MVVRADKIFPRFSGRFPHEYQPNSSHHRQGWRSHFALTDRTCNAHVVITEDESMSTATADSDAIAIVSRHMSDLRAEVAAGIADGMDTVAAKLTKLTGIKPALIDVSGVTAITSMSKATVYRMMAEGTFPRPAETPAGTRWKTRDVEKWVEGLKVRQG